MPQADFDHLVGMIYDAALQPGRWGDALQASAQALGCEMFHSSVWDLRDGQPLFSCATPDTAQLIALYHGHFGAIDPRKGLADVLGPGRMFRCHDHIDARTVSHDEFYQDFLLPHGLRYMMGGTVARLPGRDFTMAWLRARGLPPFSDDELTFAGRLVPHLGRALQLTLRQQQLHDALHAEHTAQSDGSGVICLGDQGSVRMVSEAAQRWLAPGGALRLTGGRIAMRDAAADRLLQAAWQRLRASGLPQELRIAAPVPLLLTLCRAAQCADDGFGTALAARHWLFITPLAGPRPPEAARVAALFGLTSAEARLACALAAGRSLTQAAADFGVKRSTVRSQLLDVLAKTGTARQQELVSLLQRLPALPDAG